ncbi:helix-turn-helix domain-containing protein [Sphingomonas sp. Leaf357]|uniref:helix-turn-helix domain-containing protein n=1 Tax=Sphingomonas sp. Leaf357 TaxID=1736350 RepID=UPI000AA80A4D|nr:helix-turn-helix transcriptional regulator [Sphingomonas sp. Leaf357]
MTPPIDQLSPRQRECLRLVWDRQATSKEIAIALGISKSTVDGYIAEAVEQLGARDRREAAAMAFGDLPRAASGGDAARVSGASRPDAVPALSMEASAMSRPWPSRHRQRNSLTLTQTLGWIATIAIGSLAALALATSVGNGLPSVARPVIEAVHRLTR